MLLALSDKKKGTTQTEPVPVSYTHLNIGQLCARFQLSVSTAGDSERCGKLRLTVSENPAQKFDIGCNFSLYRQIHSVPPVFCNLFLKRLFI